MISAAFQRHTRDVREVAESFLNYILKLYNYSFFCVCFFFFKVVAALKTAG